MLNTTFSCLFCNHENAIQVKIDKKAGVGTLQCKVCGQTFQTPTHYLSAPVDVYSDWVDACENVAQEAAAQEAAEKEERDKDRRFSSYAADAGKTGADDDDDADEDYA
jgi:transcription elongation factor Elf1